MMKTMLLIVGLCLFTLGCAPEDGTGTGTTGGTTTVPADSTTPGATTTTPNGTTTTPGGTGDVIEP